MLYGDNIVFLKNTIAEEQQLFDGIQEFLAVGNTEGFSSAARRLDVSVSHVSRQISALEKRLGVRLVARTTRKVKLTDAGKEYYRRCIDIAEGMEEANRVTADNTAKIEGRLRISAGGEFASQYIVPALAEFAIKNPGLSIDLDFNSRNVNFIDDGFDFAIRYGNLTDPSVVARKLLTRTLVAAASPSYLKEFGTPKHPKDLVNHNCLIANSDIWKFKTSKGLLDVQVSGKWKSNSGSSIVQACTQGLGIAYMPKSSFRNSLKSKKLEAILNPYWTKEVATWIVYPDRHFVPLRARRAIGYLLEYFENWEE